MTSSDVRIKTKIQYASDKETSPNNLQKYKQILSSEADPEPFAQDAALYNQFSQEERTQWLYSATRPPKAISVVVHGLNQRPSKMNAVAHLLLEAGHHVLRVGLSGHGNDLEAMKSVQRQAWWSEICTALRTAQAQAHHFKIPLNYVGYSLGGVLGLDALVYLQEREVQVDRLLLFAPAITPHWYTRPISWLSIIPGLVIPSKSPREYRAHNGTTCAAYRALFDVVDTVKNANLAALRSIPTLILIDEADELVSAAGIRAFCASRQLNLWKIVPVTKSAGGLHSHHLITDENAMGKTAWSEVVERILKHFDIKKFDG